MTNTVKHIYLLTAMLVLMITSACSGSYSSTIEPQEPQTPTQPSEAKRTIIVYMVSANNLGDMNLDSDDIAEMRVGVSKLTNAKDCHLLVYRAPRNATPRLFEINASGSETNVATYTDNDYSVSISRMKQVIADAKAHAPAPSYGIVFWSHGTGWLQESSSYDDPNIKPLSFGQDVDGMKMSIPALAQALEGNNFDFIYFDCCLMGTVEVAYELRNTAKEICATATELPLEGMPYNTTIPLLFDSNLDLKKVAQATYEYYCSPEASENSIAIATYNTSALNDLAVAMRKIMALDALDDDSYTGIPYFRRSVVPTGAYDMGHYVRSTCINPTLLAEFNEAYTKVVTYYAATPTSYGLDMSEFTGLGCNIFNSPTDSRLGYGYKNLQWFADVTSAHPYFN